MNFRDAIDRMPQKGKMLLIQDVLRVDENAIACRASDHRGSDYPLRLNGRLFSASLVELGAQAAAAHASLFGVGGHHAGLLLSLRDVTISEDDVDRLDGALDANAERIHFDEGGARYRFDVSSGSHEILRGEALLMMQAVNP